MASRFGSRVIRAAKAHQLNALKEIAPEVDLRLSREPEPVRPKLAKAPSETARGPGSRAVVYGAPFLAGIRTAAVRVDLDFRDHETRWSVGATSLPDFVALVQRSYLRSKGGIVLPSKASGNYFEIVGLRHPLIAWYKGELMTDYLTIISDHRGSGRAFTDGTFTNVVKFRSPLGTKVQRMDNPILIDAVRRTRLAGGEWVDSLEYVTPTNRPQPKTQDQLIGVVTDLKTGGAAGDLTAQLTRQWDRFPELMRNPNAVVEGKVGGQLVQLRVAQFLFPTDAYAASYNRIGIRAGTKANTRYDGKVVEDLNGRPYIRFLVYCRTDIMFRFFTALHHELGWQVE